MNGSGSGLCMVTNFGVNGVEFSDVSTYCMLSICTNSLHNEAFMEI